MTAPASPLNDGHAWLEDATGRRIPLRGACSLGRSAYNQVALADELPLITGQWLSDCKLTIEGSGGRINQFLGDGFFAFWRDRPGIEPRLEDALLALQRLQQASPPPFSVVLHHGALTIGGTPLGEEERLSGPEVHFVFRMDKLARTLGQARLLSEPAWSRLAPLLPAQEVGTHPVHGFEGSFRFYAF